MRSELLSDVTDVLRSAAAAEILPRYKTLADGDVQEKSAGEIVTVADREAEKIITRSLLKISPGSRVIGEEACAADASIMQNLSSGVVWLVDPLDGTTNFAAGREPFSVMTALLVNGEIVAAWMLDPVTGRVCVSERGSGAFCNGERISSSQKARDTSAFCGSVATRFMPTEMQSDMKKRMQSFGQIKPLQLCAGADYPDIAFAELDFVLYWRVLPWDHAPGALFLTEAGGFVARPSGDPYNVSHDLPGLLVARNREVWHDAQKALF